VLFKARNSVGRGFIVLRLSRVHCATLMLPSMAGFFKRIYDWLLGMFWSTEMDITMIGLQNAGKTSLLRVLAVRTSLLRSATARIQLLIFRRVVNLR